MAWKEIGDRQKIRNVIEHLVTREVEIRVWIKGEDTAFGSRFIQFRQAPSGIGEPSLLIMEKLSPGTGNALIQSLPQVAIEFSIGRAAFRFASTYRATSTAYPHYGLIVDFPEEIEIEDRREEDRVAPQGPEFVSVELVYRKGTGTEKRYTLPVHDCSGHGLGILLTQAQAELIEGLNPGDELKDVQFYAKTAMMTVNSTVRHITRVEAGEHQGCYILGISCPDTLDGPRS